MAFSVPFSFSALTFFLLITTTFSSGSATLMIHHELETTLRTLSLHGYTLFSNAITTSDIKLHLLSTTNSNFTLFAPKDAPVFDLDMTLDAIDYVSALKYHVIPNHRLAFSDLVSLSSPFLDTLLPHYSVLIGKTRGVNVTGENVNVNVNVNANVGVFVDGARVSEPDLFVGTSFVVHGIDGVLSTGFSIRHQGFDGWLGSGESRLAPPPVPFDVGVAVPAPVSEAGLNVPVGAPEASAPKARTVGNSQNETTPIGANVGNRVNDTTPVDANVSNRVNETAPVNANVGNSVNNTIPVDANVGNRVNETTPVNANVGNSVNETEPVDANVGHHENETPIDANAGNREREKRRKMPIGRNVGNRGKGKRQKIPVGSNAGNVPAGKETRQRTPVGTDKLKKKVHRVNKGRGHRHGHKRHRQQQRRDHDL